MTATTTHASNRGPIAARRDAILARRDALGLTTAELAQSIGMDPSTAFRILRGDTRPGPEFVAAYARTFGAAALVDLFPAEDAAA